MARQILQAAGTTRIPLGIGLTCKTGDLIGWDGTQWALAKADSRIPAQFIAMEAQPVAGAVTIPVDVCQQGVMFDDAAPFTAGNDMYVTTSAGAMGSLNAISTTLSIVHKIGKAIDASTVVFDLNQRGPHELRANFTYDPASLAAATARSDTGTLTGLLTTDLITRAPGGMLTGTGWDSGLVIQNMDVSSTNNLRIRLQNPTAGALDGASVTVPVYVDRY